MSRRTLLLGAAAAAALALPSIGLAQANTARANSWPTKPIRLLVGFAPGGGTDIVARALAPVMAETLGQQVVVENRAGAAGTIAADLTAKAAPDGYTLLMGHSNSNAIAPFVQPSIPYDAGADFSAITYVGYVPNVLVVHPSVPANSVDELIALTKAKPESYTYASSGVGSTQHLAGALFGKLTGSSIIHIPYKGSGQAVADLLAGQVNMNFDTMPPILPHAQSGKLRALAISTPQRLPQLPDVPTVAESGFSGFEMTQWYGMLAPKGIPADVMTKIDAAVRKAMNDPTIRPKLEQQGLQFGGPQTPAEFSKFIDAELAKYRKLVVELNVKPQ
ncbi:MAG TPA: tripartite tricarboxylate transporter substrate binding protein [Burkholderiaceae bacterium]|nr:tripartite tricarboxylate transporter substrate binding protein [Burkholderiaceae bacterium]